MFERFRERSYERRVDALKKLPLIGSTVALPERGVAIQAPHPTLIKRLMRIDGRIKYVPFDYSQLKEETGEYTYWAGVTRNLGHRVRKIFPYRG